MAKFFYLLTGVSFVATLVYLAWMFFGGQNQTLPMFGTQDPNAIKYFALGDSYTVGQGVASRDTWPAKLVIGAKARNVDLQLSGIAAQTGWTSQDLIEKGLPSFDAAQPQFVSILIGANDIVQGSNPEHFQNNLRIILDHVASQVPPEKTLLVTIPDFVVTPTGAQYAQGDQPDEIIRLYNDVIRAEGAVRGIAVADIFDLSQEMGKDPSYITKDGLHPSEIEYQRWTDVILPKVLPLLPATITP